MVVEQLVDPQGIAVVGASDKRYYARSLIANLLNAGYNPERIYPVNPRYDTVAGLHCYSSLSDIRLPLSLVVVATAITTVPTVVSEASKTGATVALVLSDGYAEQGNEGRRRQTDLQRVAKQAGIRILGPNTLGYLVPATGTAVWAPGELREPVKNGSIGVVFQSSGMMNLFLNLCITRGIGLRGAFSVGNEVGISTADLISYFVGDPDTSIIVTMIETTGRPRDLAAALSKAQASGKPVIMLKLGRSERARKNALAHTGRMASPANSWEALLKRLGVIVVSDLDELIECAALFDELVDHPRIRATSEDARVAIVTVSGGDCSLLGDLCEELDVTVANLGESTHEKLIQLLEKPDLVGNPLDMENLLQEDEGRFYEAVDALCADFAVDVVAYRMYLPATPTSKVEKLYRELTERTRAAGKVPVAMTRAIEDLDHSWYAFFNKLGVPFLPAYRPALTSLARFSAWTGRTISKGRFALEAMPATLGPAVSGHAAGWAETQEILAAAGVTYAAAKIASDSDQAASAAQELGLPVAVKLYSRAAPHKSDIGGVRLGLTEPEQVAAAVSDITAAAHAAGIEPEGFEVQRMVPPGVEMILGVTRDPTIGPLIMVGMGGVLTEITRDVVLTIPELEVDDAQRLLRRLAGFPLLDGYRGGKPADVPALAHTVAGLSRYVARNAELLVELDLNPVIVLPEGEGIVAVDALAILA